MIYKIIITKTVFVEADDEAEAREAAIFGVDTFNETEEIGEISEAWETDYGD